MWNLLTCYWKFDLVELQILSCPLFQFPQRGSCLGLPSPFPWGHIATHAMHVPGSPLDSGEPVREPRASWECCAWYATYISMECVFIDGFPVRLCSWFSRMWMVVRWTDMTVYVYSLPGGMSTKCIHLWECLELLPRSPPSCSAMIRLWCTWKGQRWCDLFFFEIKFSNCWYR